MARQSKQALELRREAATQRLIAEEYRQSGGDMSSVAFHIQEASRLDEQATALLRVTGELTIGSGGEVLTGKYAEDTLAQNPDAVSISASARRYDLIEGAGVEELAIDAAESIQEPHSLEKMLVHQMALCHDRSFKVITEAEGQKDPVEKARLLNAGARLMTVFQNGLLALNKIRTGGKQTVLVQHVQVSDGGQAVVSGVVKDKGGEDGG